MWHTQGDTKIYRSHIHRHTGSSIVTTDHTLTPKDTHRHRQITNGDTQASPQLCTRCHRHTHTCPSSTARLAPRTGRRQGFLWLTLIWRQGKELGKHFICSRLETHPTRPGNLALAPEWGLCVLPPPCRPGCGYQGGEAGRTVSLAEHQGPPSHIPGPKLESPRPEEPPSSPSPPHLEATPQPSLQREDRAARQSPGWHWISRYPLSQAHMCPQAEQLPLPCHKASRSSTKVRHHGCM